MAHHLRDEVDRVCASIRGVASKTNSPSHSRSKRADGAEHDWRNSGMPHVVSSQMHIVTQARGRNPIWNPQRKFSRLRGLKKKHAGGKQDQKPESFQPLRHISCQIFEEADETEKPNQKKLSADIPMRQPSKSEKSAAGKEFDVHCAARKSRQIAECGPPFSQKAGQSRH